MTTLMLIATLAVTSPSQYKNHKAFLASRPETISQACARYHAKDCKLKTKMVFAKPKEKGGSKMEWQLWGKKAK